MISDLDSHDDTLARVCGGSDEDSLDARLAMLTVGQGIGAALDVPRLGRYVVGKSLGRGGQGSVYEGHDPVLDRPVALKVSRFRCDDDVRFEAQALAQVVHPNVVGIYALEVHDGRPVVVMERVHGTALVEWIVASKPTLRAIVEVIACVGDGLAQIHRRGLAHRDVKPANILVDARGVPRLVDLGLAAYAGTRGLGMGTPSFAAPEQLAGVTDPACDQFGLGATLRAALRAWTDAGGVVPASLDAIVARATDTVPSRRYANVQQMAKALRARRGRRGVAAVFLVGCTLLTAGALRSETPAACGGDATQLDAVWSAATQAELAAHYDAIPHDHGRESFATARTAIDAWSQRWRDAVTVVCATDEGAQWRSGRARCLDDGASELGGVVEALASLDEDEAAAAPMLVRELPSPERCLSGEQDDDVDALEQGAALEAKRSISVARRRCQYGLTDDCAAEYDAIETAARAAGVDPCAYAPAVAFQRGVSGLSGAAVDDLALLAEAKDAAAQCDLEDIEMGATRVLADRLALRGEIDRAREQVRAAEALFDRMGRPPSVGVGLYATRSIVELAAGELTAAADAAAHAITLHDGLEWGAPGERAQLLGLYSSALLELGDVEHAIPMQLEALELRRNEVGNNHPLVAFELANTSAVMVMSDPVRSRALNLEAIAIFEQQPSGHELHLAICLSHEASSALDVDDVDAASLANARALVLFDTYARPDDPFAADALVNRGRIRLATGDTDGALTDARDAHARLAKVRGASDSSTLDALSRLGDVLAARGDTVGAKQAHCDAHAGFVAAYGAEHPLVPQLAARCPGAR